MKSTMRGTIGVLLAVFMVLGFVGALHAAEEVWLDQVNGDDLAGDGSQSYPFATIGKAMAGVDTGGVVYIAPGTFTEDITIDKSLILESTDLLNKPVIEGQISVTVNDVTLDGLEILDTVFLDPGTSGHNVLNNFFNGPGYYSGITGIDIGPGCHDLLIADNEIAYWENGILIGDGCYYLSIQRNNIHDCDVGIKSGKAGKGIGVHYNQFTDNILSAITTSDDGHQIDAQYNWWGSVAKPAGPGHTNSVSSNINTDNPLTNVAPASDQAALIVRGLPDGATLDVLYGEQDLENDDVIYATVGGAFKWRIGVNGHSGPYREKTVEATDAFLDVLEDEHYCDMKITLPDILAGAGAKVDILYGPQNLENEATVTLPTEITIKWRLEVNGFNSAYKTKEMDCTDLVVGPEDYCEMRISMDAKLVGAGAEIDILYGPQDLENSETVILPMGITIKWRLEVNGFNSAYKTKEVDCSDLVAGPADYCEMQISMDAKLVGAGAEVDILYGPQDLENGAIVILPEGITIKWRFEVNGFNSPYKTKEVDCSALVVGPSDYCELQISMDARLEAAGARVDILYGPQNLENGATVILPKGIAIKWRLEVNGFNSAYKSKTVGEEDGTCSPLAVEEKDYCVMRVTMSRDLAKAGGRVDILYGPQNLNNGATVTLPMGIDIKWRIEVNGVNSCYRIKNVDCTPLDAQCEVTVSLPGLPGDAWIQVNGVGWFKNGDTLKIAPTKKYKYRTANRNKYVKSPWKEKVFTADDCCDKFWDLTPEFCEMSVTLPETQDDKPWVQINGVAWYRNGAKMWMPMGATIKYRAANANKYVKSGWQTHNIDCNSLAPAFCLMEVDIPEGAWVQINGVGWYQDGAKLQMPTGATIKYRAANANKYVKSGWQTQEIDCRPLAPGYCDMEIQTPADAWVQINGVGWYRNGARLPMPTGATIKYRAANANKYVKSGWLTHEIDCDPLVPGFCEMEVQIPEDAWVQINGVGWYQNGAKLQMPMGATIKYRAANANKYVKSGWATHKIDCSNLAPGFCDMEVQIPEDAWVQINGVGWYQKGAKLPMPTGATIKYRAANANKYVKSGWATHKIDCSNLAPGFCDMEIEIPEDAWVQINGVGWYQNGAKLQMPMGATIKYRAANANKYVKSGWQTQEIDCDPLVPAYCPMKVDLESGVWDKVQINGVGWFADGETLSMPMGAKIKFRAQDVNGARTCWQTKPVDCTALIPECQVIIKLPAGVWININGVGWFQDGAVLDVSPGKTYKYLTANANKYVQSPWMYKVFKASDCCRKVWDLTAEYCDMEIDIPEGVWVNINGVGWYQDGQKLWMPKGARIKYLAANANKYVQSPWAYHDIDCTPLAPQYCHMEIDIPEGTWVNINGVGWYQDGQKLWMPEGAKIKYLAANANKYVQSPWAYHEIDCTPLAPKYCNMEIDIPEGTWVNINGVGWYQNGAGLWMPEGAKIKYLAANANKYVQSPWAYHEIDCTPLAPLYCELKVDIPEGTWVNINGVGWYPNGASLWMPKGAKIKYLAANANKYVQSPWAYHDIDCTPLAPLYCELEIDIPEGTWVNINGVGWYQDGDKLWMPKGSQIKYLAANANKYVQSPWAYHGIDCTPLAPLYCEMKVLLEANSWAKVNINGVGWYVNGDTLWMPMGATIKYLAQDANGDRTGWRTMPIDCSPLIPWCEVIVKLPPGVHLYIQNIGYFQDGGVLDDVKPVKTYRYKLYDSTKKVATAWKNHNFSAVDCGNTWDLTGEYCNMNVNLQGSDGWIYIENVGYFKHGDYKMVPAGASFRYKAYDSTKKVSTGWKDHSVDCGALTPGFCDMPVNLDGGDGWVYIENVGYFQNGQTKWMPSGASFRYKAYDSTKKVATGWKDHSVDCGALTPGFCDMPVDLDGGDGWVYIENVGYFKHGDRKMMPSGASFRYKAYDSTKKVATGWKNHSVDCGALTPGFCNMLVDLDGGDGWVYIENVGYFQNGNHKMMPLDASFRYKAYDSTKKVATDWKTHDVNGGCEPLKPGFCDMNVNLDGGDGWVYIENVGYFKHGDHKMMPSGASFRYKAYDSTKKVATGWQNHAVGCQDLYPGFCHMSVDLNGSDGWIYIENVGYFQNGDMKWMPKQASFRYKAYDSSKKVGTDWQTHTVTDNCDSVQPGFCYMGVSLEDPYEWVYIENAGYIPDGGSKWMPSGAAYRFKACDANKQNCTDWVTEGVDCNDLHYPTP